MPTYEYHCKMCGHCFEAFKHMCSSEEDGQRCPKCDEPVERIFGSGAGVIFHGSGFYATDYRKPQNAQAEATVRRLKAKDRITFPVTDRKGKK